MGARALAFAQLLLTLLQSLTSPVLSVKSPAITLCKHFLCVNICSPMQFSSVFKMSIWTL